MVKSCVVCYAPDCLAIYPSLTRPVSQFTLLASTKKGNKPDFRKSAGADQARELYDVFYSKVQALYREDRVKNGVFQAMMDVALVNDGPVGVDYCCEDEQVNCPVCAFGCLLARSGLRMVTNGPI